MYIIEKDLSSEIKIEPLDLSINDDKVNQLLPLWEMFNDENLDLTQFRQRFLKSNSIVLVVLDLTNRVIGFSVGSVSNTPLHDSPSFELWAIFVEDSLRLRGVGKILFSAIERIAQNLGCRRICVSSETKRSAMNFYQSVGFKKYANHLIKLFNEKEVKGHT